MTSLALSISVLVAFGTISVAANSLLNAMSIKLHEAKPHRDGYLFLYKSDKAENLRRAMGKNPRYLLSLYLVVAPFVLGSGVVQLFGETVESGAVAFQATVVCVFVTLVVWRAAVQHRKVCEVLRDLKGLRIQSSNQGLQTTERWTMVVRRWFNLMITKLKGLFQRD